MKDIKSFILEVKINKKLTGNDVYSKLIEHRYNDQYKSKYNDDIINSKNELTDEGLDFIVNGSATISGNNYISIYNGKWCSSDKFSDKEKKEILKKYFKKYWNDDKITISLDQYTKDYMKHYDYRINFEKDVVLFYQSLEEPIKEFKGYTSKL